MFIFTILVVVFVFIIAAKEFLQYEEDGENNRKRDQDQINQRHEQDQRNEYAAQDEAGRGGFYNTQKEQLETKL